MNSPLDFFFFASRVFILPPIVVVIRDILHGFVRALLLYIGFVEFAVLLLPVVDGCLDGVLRQHRAMQLHRRQVQVTCNFSVFDFRCFVDTHPLDPLGCYRAAGNC